jgi:hypothetical protein
VSQGTRLSSSFDVDEEDGEDLCREDGGGDTSIDVADPSCDGCTWVCDNGRLLGESNEMDREWLRHVDSIG